MNRNNLHHTSAPPQVTVHLCSYQITQQKAIQCADHTESGPLSPGRTQHSPERTPSHPFARRLSVFPSLFWRHSGLTSLVCFCKPLPGCELLETASGNNTHSERSRLISGTDWGSFRGSWRSAWAAFVREPCGTTQLAWRACVRLCAGPWAGRGKERT